jgi:hypothetical protein
MLAIAASSDADLGRTGFFGAPGPKNRVKPTDDRI